MLSRNLYILAGTLFFFAAVSCILGITGLAHGPGAPSDAGLWRTIGIILLLLSIVTAFLAVMQTMFEQADRRTPDGKDAVRRYIAAKRGPKKPSPNRR